MRFPHERSEREVVITAVLNPVGELSFTPLVGICPRLVLDASQPAETASSHWRSRDLRMKDAAAGSDDDDAGLFEYEDAIDRPDFWKFFRQRVDALPGQHRQRLTNIRFPQPLAAGIKMAAVVTVWPGTERTEMRVVPIVANWKRRRVQGATPYAAIVGGGGERAVIRVE